MFKKEKSSKRSVLDFEFPFCGFRFVSDFDIRISDFASAVSLRLAQDRRRNHALHLLEFGLPYIKDHFDSVAGGRELEISHEKLSERLLVFKTVNIEAPSLMPANVNTRKISLRQLDRCFISRGS
jgi:hypothetical protein